MIRMIALAATPAASIDATIPTDYVFSSYYSAATARVTSHRHATHSPQPVHWKRSPLA